MGETENTRNTVMETFFNVSAKAKINVIIPMEINKHCCGQIYSSKGFKDAFAFMANETVSKLWDTTQQGKFPVVLDISSCTQTLMHCRSIFSEVNKERYDALTIIDSIDYLHDYIMINTTVTQKKGAIVLHPVCSLKKMPGTEDKLYKIAARFADKVIYPFHAGCCGMAGDRGFLHPELTFSATLAEAKEVKNVNCDGHYSSSKTCEIALSDAIGQHYVSILNLVDECCS
ncbi:heterodisulfide reductase-related iron-sulfur binding cluster [Mucilaginibacter sp.]|jgi:D-lactate dehydrogenase|uniref:heterodisulfide reductase-related iron-sulfur binding cluster n=1 Tax=Mucilaginibacter sp. TaxID=1882438 RepID=UPI003565288B